MEMEWNGNSSWAASTYVQNIQLVFKDKTSVPQVHALKGMKETGTVRELLCIRIYDLAKDKTLVV